MRTDGELFEESLKIWVVPQNFKNAVFALVDAFGFFQTKHRFAELRAVRNWREFERLFTHKICSFGFQIDWLVRAVGVDLIPDPKAAVGHNAE